jgi:hypothetical protein
LEDLSVRGTGATLHGAEDIWMAGKGVEGKVLLPDDAPLLNDAGKPSGVLTYTYDSEAGRVRFNTGGAWTEAFRQRTAPKLAAMPKLHSHDITLYRPVVVDLQTDWYRDRTNSLIVTGSTGVGRTLTAKYRIRARNFIDSYQWKRDGKAIRGATRSTYKLDHR